MPLIWLLLALGLAVAGCSTTGMPDVPLGRVASAQAAPDLSAAADFDVPGKILVVKDGGLHQWSQGSFKPFAGGVRYQGPSFSPDGSRVAASIVGQNHSDLVILDSAGKRLVQLTDNWSKTRVQDSAWARSPAWSPDGRRIAYVTDASGAEMSLWLVDAAGGNRHQVFPAPGFGGVDTPSWSPESKELALAVFSGATSQIVLVNAVLGPVKNLTQQNEGAYDPAWSPDGERIVFVARSGGRHDLWLMDVDGSNPVRLTDVGTARAPAWSPLGDMIAFVADQGSGFDLLALRPALARPALVPSFEIKRLTEGQKLEAASGIAWSR